jgi:hypothetical protein
MATKGKARKTGIKCQRCRGCMTFEKFYGPNDVFFGWRCLICGNIFDPVILLHQISRNADIQIPDTEEKILSLIKKYQNGEQRTTSAKGPKILWTDPSLGT